MVRRLFIGAAMAGVLTLGIPTAMAFAQTDKAKQEAKQAGKDVKKAGKAAGQAAGQAAKHVDKAAKHTAKAVTRRVKGTTVTATCNDGTTFKGTSRRGACAGHRGVKSWGKA
jgi:hypothetical protein